MASPLRRIVIEAVEQHAMRPPYDQEPGCGDWFVNELGELVIRVGAASLDDPETFLVALHELIEAMLCRREGVPQIAVDQFDRMGGDHAGEPGDDPAAPYRTQHRRAMLIEHLMASFMGISDYGSVE